MLVPEPPSAQRISRAKARIRDAGARFTAPSAAELPERLAAVLHVLYLVFNEGYTATSGATLHRVRLSAEAIRLTRQLRAQLPGEGEVAGLLALMLLTDARRPARTTAPGRLVPLAEQDRARWDHDDDRRGLRAPDRDAADRRRSVRTSCRPRSPPCTRRHRRPQRRTGLRSSGLYDVLVRTAPGPMVTLNRVVALAMVRGPARRAAGAARGRAALRGHYRIAAVRAHLLDLRRRRRCRSRAVHTGRAQHAQPGRAALSRGPRCPGHPPRHSAETGTGRAT